MRRSLAELWLLLHHAAMKWNADRADRLGAALAYYAIFSLGPMLLIAIAVAGFVFGREAAQGEILGTLASYVGESGARALEEVIASSREHGGGRATVLGVALLIFAATGLFWQLQESLDSIWACEHRRKGVWRTIRGRLLSFTMVMGTGFLLLVSLLITAALAALGKLLGTSAAGAVMAWEGVNIAISLVVVTTIFALIFRYVPSCRPAWREVWPGALLTAVLFTVGKFLLGLYIRIGDVGSAHGAAGSLIVVLVWVYYSAQILFFGAEFTQVYTKRLRRKLDSVARGHIENTGATQLGGGRRRECETEAGVNR
jgi:membrane protein